MASAAHKTVRFTQVVERSGQPHVHTLWLPPEKDPEFKRARESHRLMTIEQTPGGGKADFGVVGFDAKNDAGGQFLIFPKSLKRFEGARVVGVKFDLVEQPKLASARIPKRKLSPRGKAPRARVARPTKLPAPPAQRPQKTHAPESAPHFARAPAASEPKKPVEHMPATPAPAPPSRSPEHSALIREVRAAMKELQRGKYVAAHQRLERALRE